jgi:hypothetical protein
VHPTRHNGSFTRARPDGEEASERLDSVRHIGEAGTATHLLGVESPSVVLDLEGQRSIQGRKTNHCIGGVRILRHVLQRLQNAKVHGCLCLLGKTSNTFGVHSDRERRLFGLGADRRNQTLVGQQWRVDPSGEITEVLQGVLRLSLKLIDEPFGLLQVLGRQGSGQPELHVERH